MNTKVKILVLTLFGLILIAARPMQQPDYTDLAAVLTWLAGVGAPYFVGRLFSLLAENWPTWHALPRFVKFVSPLVASALVAVLATIALQYTDVVAIASPWYTIVAAAILGYLGTQDQYISAKRSGYGSKAKEQAEYPTLGRG